jgi:hypothetical protein
MLIDNDAMVRKSKKTKMTIKSKYIIAVVGILLLSFLTGAFGYQLRDSQVNGVNAPINTRKDRITAIYKSLNLNDDYQLQSSNIFGDKRVYSWDKSRTYASSQTYERGADVQTTVAELRKAIQAAGFDYFEEPYPGSTFTELHFKSVRSEYLRLTVSSKPRDDALRNDELMTKTVSAATIALDPNAGPSNVIIKVNLDDNNE